MLSSPPGFSIAVILLAFIFSFAASAPTASRTRASFDFDWKFKLGEPCPPPVFPIPLNTVQCLNLNAQASISSAAACEAACSCGCLVWQFNPSAGCWTGSNCLTNLTNNGWVGGARETVRPNCTSGSPCDPKLPDDSWRSLAVPHDFIIEVCCECAVY